MAFDLNGDSDKIVFFNGTKYTTLLMGSKGDSVLNGDTDKVLVLSGLKNINTINTNSDKVVDLDGRKYIDSLNGRKYIDYLYGSTDKTKFLLGDEPDGFWHILISTTHIRVDTTLISSDRN